MSETGDWTEIEDEGFVGLVGPFYQRRDASGLHFRFPTTDKHRNRRGVVQGGALMTFADRALGVAVRDGRESELAATLQMDVQFVASVPLGAAVTLSPVLHSTSGATVFARGEMKVDSQVVAIVQAVYKRLGERRN